LGFGKWDSEILRLPSSGSQVGLGLRGQERQCSCAPDLSLRPGGEGHRGRRSYAHDGMQTPRVERVAAIEHTHCLPPPRSGHVEHGLQAHAARIRRLRTNHERAIRRQERGEWLRVQRVKSPRPSARFNFHNQRLDGELDLLLCRCLARGLPMDPEPRVRVLAALGVVRRLLEPRCRAWHISSSELVWVLALPHRSLASGSSCRQDLAHGALNRVFLGFGWASLCDCLLGLWSGLHFFQPARRARCARCARCARRARCARCALRRCHDGAHQESPPKHT
jgi:hypothetical protein